MNKVHGPLNLAQSSREASFFPVQGNLLLLNLIDIPHCVGFRANPLQRRALAAAGPGHCCAQQHLVHRNGSSM